VNLDLHKERAELLEQLLPLSTEARHDRVYIATIETGGSWIGPHSSRKWPSTHQVEIDLLGVLAIGEDDAQAIHNWMTIVQRQVATSEQELAS